MKFKWDPIYVKYSFYASLTLFAGIAFYNILDNLSGFVSAIRGGLGWFRWLVSPFIIGGFIAYFLNPGVRWFERFVWSHIGFLNRKVRMRRNLSILSVFLILVLLTGSLVFFVSPQIASNVQEISRRAPEYIRLSEAFLNDLSTNLEQIDIDNLTETVEGYLNRFLIQFDTFVDENLGEIFTRAITITAGLLNVILGIVISFYILADKDSFKRISRKTLRAFFAPQNACRIEDFFREADALFSKYIVGKSLDSFIIGVMCFIGLRVLDIRYALLLSVIVAVTNMIPYFGPFIGMVPAAFLTFFDSPAKALWVILFILALQQFDGLFLGPKILGNSVGLPPFWIIFSIIVGGKLAGILGMLIGVPVFGVVWLLLTRIFDTMTRAQEQRARVCGPEVCPGADGPDGPLEK